MVHAHTINFKSLQWHTQLLVKREDKCTEAQSWTLDGSTIKITPTGFSSLGSIWNWPCQVLKKNTIR